MDENLAIKDVADRTGLAAGTIRMWEQRYGFPVPQRNASGYRRYHPDDVETLNRVQAYRRTGLSVAAAIERAREAGGPSDRPSLYAAIAASARGATPQVLRKPTLEALSRAIEHETLAHAAAPVLVAAFQRERFYRAIEPRWRRMAAHADAAVVFADFAQVRRPPGGPVELPIDRDAAVGNEWALVVDAPGFAACLAGWEQPGSAEPGGPADRTRRFETIWTLDPEAARRAVRAATRLAASIDPACGAQLDAVLADRPLALEQPAPALTALANRAVAYLERDE